MRASRAKTKNCVKQMGCAMDTFWERDLITKVAVAIIYLRMRAPRLATAEGFRVEREASALMMSKAHQ